MQVQVIPFETEKEEQLSLPLFFIDKAPVIQLPTNNLSKPNTYEWTDSEVELIREKLLMDSLKSLTDARAVQAKKEAMNWMMSDKALPFSFRTCANSMGLCHKEIRVRVLHMIAQLEKKAPRS